MGEDDNSTFDDGGPSIRFTESFTNDEVLRKLRKLAVEGSDERASFKEDPQRWFAGVGIKVADGLIPGNSVVLPPAHQVRELLYYLAGEDEFSEAGQDPPLGFTMYVLVWAFKWGGT